ncbi:MAG: hypothetical protein U0Q07_18440 [Acidimicrobiales bacterium]
MNDKVYIHELIDVIGQNRARYMHHMTANWVPVAIEERDQRCFGVFGTVGSTGRWPEVVNLWELDGWDGLVGNFSHELSHDSLQDPSLAEWWSVAASLRRGGFDRIVVPAPWTRTIDELVADGVRGEVYAHELIEVPPGGAPDLLDALASVGRATVEALGATLVGAFRVAMVGDREVILLWALPSWDAWAVLEQEDLAGDGGALAPWRAALLDAGAKVHRTLLVEAPLSPMRLGRQPEVGDRRPLDDL